MSKLPNEIPVPCMTVGCGLPVGHLLLGPQRVQHVTSSIGLVRVWAQHRGDREKHVGALSLEVFINDCVARGDIETLNKLLTLVSASVIECARSVAASR
jgi:hypothetical protein